MLTLNQKVPTEWVEQFEQKISWEEAISIGVELRENKDNSQWRLGDLALQVETVYGQDAIGKLAIDININKKSLQQYRRVSNAFPPKTRSQLLSHRHHMMLVPYDNRFDLLREAEENNLTTSQLELKLCKNPQKEIVKKEVLVCEKCHKLIVKPNNICLCSK